MNKYLKYTLIIGITALLTCIVTLTVDNAIEKQREKNESYSAASANDVTVYITKTGSRYHRKNCSSLQYSKIKISLAEAADDYSRCSHCNPPRVE